MIFRLKNSLQFLYDPQQYAHFPRQRLDVVVNILTNYAFHKRQITVFGGNQLRPNIHIADMVNAYLKLIEANSEVIVGKIYNAGYENQSVLELAETVKNVIGNDVTIEITPTDDNRSYHISSEKIRKELDYVAKFSIRDAIVELVEAFKQNKLPNSFTNENYYNIKKMQNINLK